MRHQRRSLQHRIGHTGLEKIGHSLAARDLMGEDRRRSLARRSAHLAYPYASAFAHVPRDGFDAAVGPVRLAGRMKARRTVEVLEIGADPLAVLHAEPAVVGEAGAAGGRL